MGNRFLVLRVLRHLAAHERDAAYERIMFADHPQDDVDGVVREAIRDGYVVGEDRPGIGDPQPPAACCLTDSGRRVLARLEQDIRLQSISAP